MSTVAPNPLLNVPAAGLPSSPAGDIVSYSLESRESSVNPLKRMFANRHNPKPLPPAAAAAAARQKTVSDVPQGPPLDPDQVFRHSGWEATRARVRDSLLRTGQTPRRVEAFDQCGREAWVQEDADNPGSFRCVCQQCHDRLCVPCALQRSRELAASLQAAIAGTEVSFLTLTLSHRKQSLGKTIDDLYRHFRALRQHPEWKSHVAGGAAFLELKWSTNSQQWHPHLHIIMHAKFWGQGFISTIWQTITHDTYIVDIRRVSDQPTISKYVTKYASKPLNSSFSHSPDLLDQGTIAIKGRRLCLCFGTWYGTPLSERMDHEDADTTDQIGRWQPIARLSELHDRAGRGEARALAILQSLSVWRRACLTEPDPPA